MLNNYNNRNNPSGLSSSLTTISTHLAHTISSIILFFNTEANIEINHINEKYFIFSYETENAIQQNEEGSLKRIKNEEGKDEDVVVVRGSYSYQDPLGQLITVTYYADETGFHAEGAHIPVPNAVATVRATTQPPFGIARPSRPRF